MKKLLMCALFLVSFAANAADFWAANCLQSIAMGQTISGTISTSTDCSWNGSDTSKKWYTDVYTFSGTAGQKIAISMTGSGGLMPTLQLYLGNNSLDLKGSDITGGISGSARIPEKSGYFTLPSTGTYFIWASPLSTNSGGSYSLTLTSDVTVPTGFWPTPCIQSISFGQTISGEIIWRTINGEFLTPIDCGWNSSDYKLRWYTDIYAFSGTAGQQISIAMNTLGTLDPYLFLYFGNANDDLSKIASDNNGGGGLNARIPANTGYITLPTTGTYLIWAASNYASAGGKYTLTLTSFGIVPSPPTCSLSAQPAAVSAGNSTTLTASCTPSATSYNWTGGSCAGATGASCTASPATTTTYTVQGSNAGGSGNTASATVTVSTSAPTCSLSAQPASVSAGGSTTLTASCNPTATSYSWTGGSCAGITAASCTATPSVTTTFTVQGSNASGTGAAASAMVTVNTGGSTPYTGLWGNPNEPGWGISVTQHANMIFAAIYTYDSVGQPTWYVMSSCPIVAAGSCTGELYLVSGGSPPSVPWNGSGKTVSSAGSGTLTFDDANHGRFAYTLKGVVGSRAIERQLFSNGTPQFSTDYTDLWWNSGESGWGVALTQDHAMIFAAWFTYDEKGGPAWYVASSCPLANTPITGDTCTGDLYRVTGGSSLAIAWTGADRIVTKVGTVLIAFSGPNNAQMSYTINGDSAVRAITRQVF